MIRNNFLFYIIFVFLLDNITAQNYFLPGEKIEYNINFGFLKVGEALVKTDTVYKVSNQKKTIRVTMTGNTVGAIGFFSHIENKYYSDMDSITHYPLKFERKQHENNFKLFEINDFEQENNNVNVTRLNYNTSVYNIKNITTSGFVHDMISGYFDLRNKDISLLKKNDTISLKLFFEEKNYDVKFKYLERDKIKTKIGKFKSFVFSLILPENSILSKREDPVKIWISDDKRRIPLNISMFTKYGKFEIDIKKYDLPQIKN